MIRICVSEYDNMKMIYDILPTAFVHNQFYNTIFASSGHVRCFYSLILNWLTSSQYENVLH